MSKTLKLSHQSLHMLRRICQKDQNQEVTTLKNNAAEMCAAEEEGNGGSE